MKVDSIRDMLQATPFRPFNLRLADGRSVKVPHPNFITVTGAGRTAIVASAVDDHFTIIDLLLVTQLEAGDTTSTAN